MLRIQSLIDVYGSSASRLVNNKQSVEDILRNSFFQRISIFKKIETSPIDRLPVLKRISFSKSKNDKLPQATSPFLESMHLRAKIKSIPHRSPVQID